MSALIRPSSHLTHFLPWIDAILLLVLGVVLAGLISRVFQRINAKRGETQQFILLRKLVYAVILVLFAASALQQIGFKLSVLLGAAGVLTLAIGFASQTSISNIISGIFLILERSFTVGDRIKVGDTIGQVLSIDLLSVKLKTEDNVFIRIANENLIKTEIRNLTKYKVRRLLLPVAVKPTTATEINKIMQLLTEAVQTIEGCLKKPAAMVVINNISATEINLSLFVWVAQDQITGINNQLQLAVNEVLAGNHIERV